MENSFNSFVMMNTIFLQAFLHVLHAKKEILTTLTSYETYYLLLFSKFIKKQKNAFFYKEKNVFAEVILWIQLTLNS